MLQLAEMNHWEGQLDNMRIAEIDDPHQKESLKHGSIVTLLNLIKSNADSRGVPAVLSNESFFKLLQNIGYNLSIEEFEQLQGEVPAIGNLVSSMDDEKIVISSKNESDFDDADNDSEIQNTSSQDPRGTVKKMAKRAAKRRES